MIINLDIPGAHGRIRLPGGWPGLAELTGLADALAESVRRCPDCAEVPASDFLRAMARVAPADLAPGLHELAGPEPASRPSEAERALAALYEKHAGELAAIEAAYKARPPRAAR